MEAVCRMPIPHPRALLRTVAGTPVVMALSAGCAATGGADTAVAADSFAVGAASPQQARAASPVDPEAPGTCQPVVRPGKATRPTLAAATGRLAAGTRVRYPDAVSVGVDRITSTVEKASGAGAFPGRPLTALALTMTNGSSHVLDLSQVVVTTAYGERPRTAAPVYGAADATDFAGTLTPRGTARATYVFAIPPGQAKVSVRVDFDGDHAAATFTGAVL